MIRQPGFGKKVKKLASLEQREAQDYHEHEDEDGKCKA
jgi:hypothetical protein